MKDKKNKLSLNKETISFLDKKEMMSLKGGTGISIQIVSIVSVSTIIKPQPDPWKPDPTPWITGNISIRH